MSPQVAVSKLLERGRGRSGQAIVARFGQLCSIQMEIDDLGRICGWIHAQDPLRPANHKDYWRIHRIYEVYRSWCENGCPGDTFLQYWDGDTTNDAFMHDPTSPATVHTWRKEVEEDNRWYSSAMRTWTLIDGQRMNGGSSRA